MRNKLFLLCIFFCFFMQKKSPRYISALGFVLINLLVDLVMPRLDPRLQLQTGGVK